MTTDTEALTYDHIVALALEHGFKLKPQVDGRMALNDYVIDFARAVYDIGHAAAKAEAAMRAAAPTANAAPVAQGDARAEQALLKVLAAVQRYLPPDGPSAKDTLSEIIGIVDPWPLGDLKGKA